jgi:endonuclease/exonuclease/phosphatase family metal-dependent hydrolase
VRILTWNLWGRFGGWKTRQRAILTTLRASNADVIAVQESWNARARHQVDVLADDLQLHRAYVADESFGSGDSGNGVLSRWPIGRVSGRRLEGTTEASGGFAVHAELDGPRGPIQVFSVILDAGLQRGKARQLELHELVDWVRCQAGDGPVLVCGDLNAAPDSSEIGMLVGSPVGRESPGFVDAWAEAGGPGPGYTWSHDNPGTSSAGLPDRRIDYVLSAVPHPKGAGKPLHCRLAGIHPVGGVQPSDHYAVLADLTY